MRLLERLARRSVALLDALATRAFGAPWNPFHQTGTVAVAMLLLLTVTGLYLVFFYRLGAPYASVAELQADPWLGAWIRTLHRYASGLFVAAGALHALRMFAQERSWGPRTLAWISGLVIFGAGLICAWTGYVMVWDTFGERLPARARGCSTRCRCSRSRWGGSSPASNRRRARSSSSICSCTSPCRWASASASGSMSPGWPGPRSCRRGACCGRSSQRCWSGRSSSRLRWAVRPIRSRWRLRRPRTC
ncbi:MAG: hypothetical protein R2909_03490 [Gemmatimonadales bacterium]